MEKSANVRPSGVRTPTGENVASAWSAVILENHANSVQCRREASRRRLPTRRAAVEREPRKGALPPGTTETAGTSATASAVFFSCLSR